MSRRTLQRKLAEADLTYQQLVDDTRRDLALRYIEDPGKSITEITFLLGFSGPERLYARVPALDRQVADGIPRRPGAARGLAQRRAHSKLSALRRVAAAVARDTPDSGTSAARR